MFRARVEEEAESSSPEGIDDAPPLKKKHSVPLPDYEENSKGSKEEELYDADTDVDDENETETRPKKKPENKVANGEGSDTDFEEEEEAPSLKGFFAHNTFLLDNEGDDDDKEMKRVKEIICRRKG